MPADDRVYDPGGDVKTPKLVHYVEPEFSPSSREAYVEGTVKISTVVTTAGKPAQCRVVRGLSAEEDRTAMEVLKQWSFEPGIPPVKGVARGRKRLSPRAIECPVGQIDSQNGERQRPTFRGR